ncbi:MAG: hypothetical protein ABI835_03715 [Chloroflexota bacterium]
MLRRLILVFVLVLLLGSVQIAFGHDVLQGDQCTINGGEHIRGNVFALCRILTISGEVDGDLFGGGSTILIDGTVTGSLYLVGGQLDISGRIGQDVHFAGGALNILPSAEFLDESGDLISVNLSTQVDNGGIPGSVTSASYQLVLNGAVDHDVSFWGSALVINNTVGGDVTATVGDPASTGVSELGTLFNFLPYEVSLVLPGLRINDGGMVNGQLRYEGASAGEIAVTLPNPPVYTPMANSSGLLTTEKSLLENVRDYAAQAIREFISLALIGAAGLLLVSRTLQAPIYSLRVRPLPSLGVGLLTFILSIPIFFVVVPLFGVLLVLVLTVLQLSDLALIAGIIVFVLDLGGAGLFYFTAIFISRVIVCIAIGRFMVRALFGNRPERSMTYVSLLIGVVLLALVSSLPYLGFLINAVAAFFGIGAIIMLILRELENARQANHTRIEPSDSESARQLPPPAIEERALGPGMDNLPSGFQWWK